jgi:hypothetical protein
LMFLFCFPFLPHILPSLHLWVMYSPFGEGEGEPLKAVRKGVRFALLISQ